MVLKLLKIQFTRLTRQKLLYLYFVVMAAIIISNAFQCMDSLEDNGMTYYAGGKFPTMYMQSYIDIIGTLFLSFITAVLICGERADGMLKQPLLNGVTKKQLFLSKTVSILIIVRVCFLQMLLLVFPQTTMVLFLVFLSLYMTNISSMMCASLIILLMNNLFSQFFASYISFIDFMYYLYAFSGYNGMALTNNTMITGIVVNTITGSILVCGILRRIDNN